MAVYSDNYTAMVIFAQTQTQFGVQAPNTINPDGSDTPYSPPTPNTPNIPQQNNNGGFSYSQVKKAVVGLGLYSAVKSSLNYVKNNYGDIMQDSNKQAEINEAMNIIGMATNIGTGFAIGGVVGGIASIVSTGVSIGLQTASYQRMMHRNSVQSEISMARTQYATINGGR